MNKEIVRQTMLSLEEGELRSARENYLDYVSSARLDRSEPIEDDEQAQAEFARSLSEALDDSVHDHTEKMARLRTIDFGPKTAVAEGAVVELQGRHFVIAVSTGKFLCEGKEMMGISTGTPIYAEMEGKHVGETVAFNGRELVIGNVV